MTLVLAAITLVVMRTTVICRNKLNIDTNHNNSNSCSSTSTIGTINTNVRNDGSSTGSNNRVSAHTKIKNLSLVTVVLAA